MGVDYTNRSWVRQKDPLLGQALDSIAQGSANVGSHIAATPNIVTTAPVAPSSLTVIFANGVFQATLVDTVNNPTGLGYYLDYSPNPQFPAKDGAGNPVTHTVNLGSAKAYQQNWGNQTLYFRARSKYIASAYSPFTYYGSQASPIAVTGTGGGSGMGTVTSIATTAPITGGPITTTGTIGVSLATSVAVGVVKPDNASVTVNGSGTLSAVTISPLGPFADDTAAAAGGVAVGQIYYLPSGFAVVRLV